MQKFTTPILCILLISSIGCFAQSATKINTATTSPKLVVGIVVDQMRWDYLYRYSNLYGNGGFKRMLNKGYSYQNTLIPYVPTVTAAGHTTVYTGTVPAIHGIVGNDWVEKQTGAFTYCSQDMQVKLLPGSSSAGYMSPKNMLTSTIGDELRLATNFKSRVFGIALKDRGAILPAGHLANTAYWFDDSTGNWITNQYYLPQNPTWLDKFNAQKKPDAFFKTEWNLLYPLSTYTQSTNDDVPFEIPLKDEKTVTFPHKFSNATGYNYNPLRVSPYGNTFTFDFAKNLLVNEALGKNGQTDMLCISLSSTDYIGHRFGPQSIEMQDTYLRLDRDIEDFLTMLDQTLGVNEYVVFLTADHGAAYTPDYLKTIKHPAGNLQSNTVKKLLNTTLEEKYSIKNIVNVVLEYQVFLNHKLIDSLKLNVENIEKDIIIALYKMPEIANAFAYSQFEKAILPPSLKNNLANSYYYNRSCDVQYILKPQYTDGNGKGTDHGAIFTYDTHIPLLWYGKGIPKGKNYSNTYMVDIAPTIAAMLNIQMPNGSVGKILTEIVK